MLESAITIGDVDEQDLADLDLEQIVDVSRKKDFNKVTFEQLEKVQNTYLNAQDGSDNPSSNLLGISVDLEKTSLKVPKMRKKRSEKSKKQLLDEFGDIMVNSSQMKVLTKTFLTGKKP